jgi:hypothetical protein
MLQILQILTVHECRELDCLCSNIRCSPARAFVVVGVDVCHHQSIQRGRRECTQVMYDIFPDGPVLGQVLVTIAEWVILCRRAEGLWCSARPKRARGVRALMEYHMWRPLL